MDNQNNLDIPEPDQISSQEPDLTTTNQFSPQLDNHVSSSQFISPPNQIIKTKHVHRLFFWIIALLLILIVGAGIYEWQHHTVNNLNAKINTLNVRVGVLNKQLNTSKYVMNYLNNSFGYALPNIVKLPKLGVEFTIPFGVPDLTYSYSKSTTGFGNNAALTAVSFSTTTLQKLNPSCTASAGDALGTMMAIQGIHTPPLNAYQAMFSFGVVKQFPKFYITFGGTHQAICAGPTDPNGTLVDLLITIQQSILDQAVNNSIQLLN